MTHLMVSKEPKKNRFRYFNKIKINEGRKCYTIHHKSYIIHTLLRYSVFIYNTFSVI